MKDRFNVLRDTIHSNFRSISIKWILLVAINAAPSLWIALKEGHNPLAMISVILCFILFYARLEWHWRQDQQRFSLHLSILNTGVMLRCLSTPLFMSIDIFTGAIAIQTVESSFQGLSLSKNIPFLSTFLITFLQGTFLSLVLVVLGSLAVAMYRILVYIRLHVRAI
ncbi:MAG: hypothetical protein AAF518_23940 [Spirochaetota bacterium]